MDMIKNQGSHPANDLQWKYMYIFCLCPTPQDKFGLK